MPIRTKATPLAAEDAARWHMSLPQNPMVIAALLLLQGPIPRVALDRLLQERLLPYPRFRSSIHEPPFGLGFPSWVEDTTFDLNRHVHSIRLPTSSSFREVVGELVNRPLLDGRPLWSVHHIEQTDRAALLFRVHHCLADGAALLGVLRTLSGDGPVQGESAEASQPTSPARRARDLVAGALGAGRLLLRRPDTPGPLHPVLGLEKRVAFSEALPLGRVRAQSHAMGVTIPELLLAATAAATRECFGVRDRKDRVHALVPVPLGRSTSSTMGNQFASVYVRLPVHLAQSHARVHAVRAELRVARARATTRAAPIVDVAGMAAARIERWGVLFFSRKASVVASSVRGPEQRLSLVGVPIEDLVVWAPAPGRVALSVTLTSYAGQVRLGVSSDAQLAADPDEIIRVLSAELQPEPAPSPPAIRD